MKRYILSALGVLMLVSTGYVLQGGETEVPIGGLTKAQIDTKLATEEQVFAHVDPATDIVDFVGVVTQETIDDAGGWYVSINGEIVFKPKAEWIQTSTKGTTRKNPAGKDYTYDKNRNAFIPPKPSEVATFNESKAGWDMPAYVRDCTGATTTCP